MFKIRIVVDLRSGEFISKRPSVLVLGKNIVVLVFLFHFYYAPSTATILLRIETSPHYHRRRWIDPLWY